MDMIVTDFGEVRLSETTIAGLDSMHPGWREIAKTPNYKLRAAEKRVKQFVEGDLVSAVNTIARLRFLASGTLEEV